MLSRKFWLGASIWDPASLVAQTVKRLPAVQETWVQSLGWENPLEKEMATHSSTLAWKIPRTEEPGRLQSMGSQRVGHNWATSVSVSSVLAWRIPGTGEPGGLPSMGLHRVGHDWNDIAAAASIWDYFYWCCGSRCMCFSLKKTNYLVGDGSCL